PSCFVHDRQCAGQVPDTRGRRHESQAVPGQVVLRCDTRTIRYPTAPYPLEITCPVVTTAEHLQQRSVVDETAIDALCQQPHQRLGTGHHLLDPLRTVRGIRVPIQIPELLTHPRVHPRPVPTQQRLREPTEHHTPGQVPHRGEPHLGRHDQTFQRLPDDLSGRVHRCGFQQPLLQYRRHDPHIRGGTLLCQEDAEDSVLQFRRAVQLGHTVVSERAPESFPERLRKIRTIDIETL